MCYVIDNALIVLSHVNRDSRFCAKCRMVLAYDAYNDTVEEKKKQEYQLEQLKRKQDKFEQLIQSLIDSGQLRPNTKQ